MADLLTKVLYLMMPQCQLVLQYMVATFPFKTSTCGLGHMLLCCLALSQLLLVFLVSYRPAVKRTPHFMPFFALSVLSTLLSAFLIAYYAVHVYWNNNYNTSLINSSYYSSLDASLGATMLGLSCTTLFVSAIATIASCLGAGVCGAPKAQLLKIGAAAARQRQGNNGALGNFNLGNLNPLNAFR